jgi:hypothetical protein
MFLNEKPPMSMMEAQMGLFEGKIGRDAQDIYQLADPVVLQARFSPHWHLFEAP